MRLSQNTVPGTLFPFVLIVDHERQDAIRGLLPEIYAWSNAQFGPYGVAWGLNGSSHAIRALFKTEADAMHFALRWK